MSSDATNGYNFIMTDYIVNGAEYGENKVAAEEVGVKAVDERTLEVHLKNPTPYFLYLTTLSMYFSPERGLCHRAGRQLRHQGGEHDLLRPLYHHQL